MSWRIPPRYARDEPSAQCRAGRLSRPAVRRPLRRARELAAIGAPVSPVLDFDLDGDDVTLALYDLASAAP
jgi:hypothetical protein